MNAVTILQLAIDLAELAFEQGREDARGWHSIARVTGLARNDVLCKIEAELVRVDMKKVCELILDYGNERSIRNWRKLLDALEIPFYMPRDGDGG